ncbi:MAG: hypothetical protein EHM18_00480 [Acidobacteria bacterium]|nr:MAG: hypothetical protein EHM18_00480 [Acidobacteriota bacterium]
MRCHKFFLPVLLVLISLPALAFQHDSEAKAEVPALSDFHDVIYVIWHEAWPAKDHAKLRSLLPDIEKGAAAVISAPLPGILHHKKSAWDDGLQALKSTVEEYRTAVKAENNEALMAAAEKLHSNYERLVRVIRPPLRELEDFHASLYMLYHHHLPAYDLAKIKSSSAELKQKMTGLEAAKLPDRLSAKKQDFDKARQELATAVAALEPAVQSGDKAKVTQAVEDVHSRYEATQDLLAR